MVMTYNFVESFVLEKFGVIVTCNRKTRAYVFYLVLLQCHQKLMCL